MNDVLLTLADNATQIILALLGFLGIAVSNVYTLRVAQIKDKKLQKLQLETDFKCMTLGFNQFLSQWNKFLPELEELMANTVVDRFMVLCAWNGQEDPKFTTAIYQFHKTDHIVRQYINFELDTNYRDMLRSVQIRGEARIRTTELPHCVLRGAYEDEQVTEALIFMLSYEKLRGSEAAAITYCSFATHDNAPIDERTAANCRRVANMLKGLANNYVNM